MKAKPNLRNPCGTVCSEGKSRAVVLSKKGTCEPHQDRLSSRGSYRNLGVGEKRLGSAQARIPLRGIHLTHPDLRSNRRGPPKRRGKPRLWYKPRETPRNPLEQTLQFIIVSADKRQGPRPSQRPFNSPSFSFSQVRRDRRHFLSARSRFSSSHDLVPHILAIASFASRTSLRFWRSTRSIWSR